MIVKSSFVSKTLSRFGFVSDSLTQNLPGLGFWEFVGFSAWCSPMQEKAQGLHRLTLHSGVLSNIHFKEKVRCHWDSSRQNMELLLKKIVVRPFKSSSGNLKLRQISQREMRLKKLMGLLHCSRKCSYNVEISILAVSSPNLLSSLKEIG